ncbi:MAG: cytochrome c oxidase assembly protein [Acidimicrobiia bacterium]|nr:cytochrome c oxidase assembly protein [Acidimicrobiia bacterium]
MSALAAAFPAWEANPDVWLVVGLLAAAYVIAIVRLGPALAPDPRRPVTTAQVISFGLGIFATWLAADWPVHELAEDSLYSVHMVQHLTFTLVATPLLLMGTPGWMLRALLGGGRLLHAVRWLARFLPAVILYNLVLVVSHWPAVVDLTLRNGLAHFVAHVIIFVTALVVWLPVLSPLPEIPRLAPPLRMLYLFLQSVLPTVPASFLTFGKTPLYRYYESVDQLFGLSTVEDQRIAGLIMKVGAGFLLWTLIAVLFFRWYSEEEAASDRERRLNQTRDAPSPILETR